MNTRKKFSAVVVALALTVGLVVGAGAATAQQKITATLDQGITIKYDGEIVIPKDANGKRVYPIMYNGNTYLPLRAMGGMLGLDVDWDQATRTVLLGQPADGVDLLDLQKAYYLTSGGSDLWARHTMTSDKKTTTVNGYTLTHWLQFYSWTFKKTGASSMASFNIEGKYDTVTFRYYAEFDATLEVIGDNDSVLWTKDITGSQLYQEVTVDLLKTNQLTFKFTNKGTGTMNGFVYDARLK